MTAIQLVLVVQLLAAEPQQDPGQFIRVERLAEHTIIAYWPGIDRRCNLTAIQSRKGLVMIDTEASPRVMAPIKDKMERTLGRNDWAYVINTHAHDNHCSGNSLFKGAAIVGHENLPADMQWLIRRQTEPDWKRKEIEHYTRILSDLRAAQPQYAANRVYTRLIQSDLAFYDLFLKDMQQGYEVVKPAIVFADRRTLDLGDLSLELIFFGKGHSNSDILIYVPQDRVLVTGSTIAYKHGMIPEIGEETRLEDVHRSISVLDSLLTDNIKIDRVVPSHSALLTRSDLPPARDYYQRMLKEVAAARRDGLTLEETIRRLTLRAKFPAFHDPRPNEYGYGWQDRNIKNLWRILAEPGRKMVPSPSSQ